MIGLIGDYFVGGTSYLEDVGNNGRLFPGHNLSNRTVVITEGKFTTFIQRCKFSDPITTVLQPSQRK